MVNQGEVYDLAQELSEDIGFGDALFMFSNNLPEKKIRGNLQIRYRSAGAYDELRERILSLTNSETIGWNASKHRLVSSEGDQVYLDQFEVADIDESFDQVLKDAYEDILIKERTERLLDNLSTGEISRTSRIIAGLALRHNRTKTSDKIDSSFLWDTYNLIETENIEQMARKDILNELVRAGCIVRDGSNMYLLPEFTALENPEEYLPMPTVSNEWKAQQ